MSLNVINRFKCDQCGKVKEVPTIHKKPAGWVKAEGSELCSWQCLAAWAKRMEEWEAKREEEEKEPAHRRMMRQSKRTW